MLCVVEHADPLAMTCARTCKHNTLARTHTGAHIAHHKAGVAPGEG